MYKKVLKNIHSDIRKKEDFLNNLYKNSDKKLHAIHDKLPHFIFSAENPMHPAKFSMSHEEALQFLQDKGYDVESMKGKYGKEEKSILIHNPPKSTHRHLMEFARNLGQDSAILSDSYSHEMHYLNGPKAGQHHKGQGTLLHNEAPEDFYSTLSDGTHFTHGFDFDKRHKDSDFIKDIPGKIKKSEQLIINGTYRLKKAEDGPKHKLARAGAGTKLVHFSPQEGLEEIHPDHHGVRKIGAEARQGAPKHRMSFYYAEGVEPESIVTSGSRKKYVVDLGDKKLYDIGRDELKLSSKAREKAQKDHDEYARSKGWTGQSIVDSETVRNQYHQAIKDAGYHGIYNSSLNDTMSHAVGMFEPMKPEAEYKIHANDLKQTSAKDHHNLDTHRESAKKYAEENGHNNPDFLHNLSQSFRD